jgi:hypothetical protein
MAESTKRILNYWDDPISPTNKLADIIAGFISIALCVAMLLIMIWACLYAALGHDVLNIIKSKTPLLYGKKEKMIPNDIDLKREIIMTSSASALH